MKTLELSDAEFQFLGSLIGNCFCGNHPTLMDVYDQLYKLNNQQIFEQPKMNFKKSRDGVIYLEAPTIGKVISYNISAGRDDKQCRAEIEEVIKKHGGVVIDV